MSNRKEHLTKLVIQVVTNIVYITWAQNTTILLLQLDIKRAFDIVNYIQLLDTMQKKGYLL